MKIEFDAEGYLLNPQQWNENVANFIAQQDNLQLTELHWEIIYLVRNFYTEYQTSPAVRLLVKAVAQKFGSEKGNSRYLQKLFPQGVATQVCKLAGLPKPAKCL